MNLPRGWTKARLGDIVIERVAHAAPTARPVPYIDIGAIDRERKVISETQMVTASSAPTRARQWVKGKDVLVSMTRPNLNAVAQVPESLASAVASTGFDVLRAVGVLPEWIYYRVRSRAFVQDVCADVQGVMYPAIRPADVRRHELPVPPLAEQARIVEALESQLSRLDAAVASLDRAQAKLKAYRASVLKAAAEGRLVRTEADIARHECRSYEPAGVLIERILKERRRRWETAELAKMDAAGRSPRDARWREKYEEPQLPDVLALPDLPEGWRWVTMGLLIDAQQNGLYVPASRYGLGVPILRIDDYQWDASRASAELKKVDISVDDARKYGLRPNDIVLNRVNSMTHLGKALVVSERHVPAVFESNMMRLALMPGVSPHFIHIYLSSSLGRRLLTSNAKWAVNQASINQADVASCAVPLPPLAEQLRIVAEVERLASVASAAAHSVSADRTRCVALRQSILCWAFAGTLVEQRPGDEPAEALLARIAVDRVVAAPGTKRSRKLKATS
jgi:type I restriction enzyme S subunit